MYGICQAIGFSKLHPSQKSKTKSIILSQKKKANNLNLSLPYTTCSTHRHKVSTHLNLIFFYQASFVEVELFSSSKNKIVKAMLTKDSGEPKWFINNKPVSKEKLLQLTKQLQIQPGNLCQFLPQDVVREFPQMKSSEIFENTIKVKK